MQCTPQEIEEKRRIAQEKLAKKLQQSPLRTNQQSTTVNNVNGFKSPRFKFHKTNSPLKSTTSNFNHNMKPYEKQLQKPAVQFYGKDKVVTGKCCLISDTRFSVELVGFSTQVVDVFKTIPSKNYNPKTRLWDFHINHHDLLIQRLQPLSLVIEKIPTFVLNCCKSIDKEVNLDYSRLDPELYGALMPFQEEGLKFGVDKNGRCLIADDMGLGKTFQALAIANYYKKDWPLLIVTTASMKNVWESTIHKYLPSVSIMSIQYMVSAKDYIADAKILIVSHDMMTRSVNKLLEKNFGVIVIDESHVLKNFKAKCTKAATLLAKKARRIVLLSGTPALSRPSELYSQLSLLDEKFFGTFFDYSKRYCDGKTTSFGWDASGKSNLQELEIILNKKFMIRRTKEDVLKSLPNKVQEVITLDVNLSQFSEEDRKCLSALAIKFNMEKKGAEKHALLLTFFAETAKIKIPSVCSYVLQVLEQRKKFLIFGHHQIMLNSIEKILKKKNVKFIRIDGNTSSDQRKYFVDKFQFDNSYMCALLSITAANAGITLTAAHLVLFAELHWNPSILSQAESRAHRIGQENQVVVRYLLAPGTADDSIWPMLQEKQKILGEAGLSKDNFNDVRIKKQECDNNDDLTDGLDITISNVTVANTLDITTYFKSPSKSDQSNKSDSSNCANDTMMDLFDDGFDEILCKSDEFSEIMSKSNCETVDLFNDGLDDVLCNIDL